MSGIVGCALASNIPAAGNIYLSILHPLAARAAPRALLTSLAYRANISGFVGEWVGGWVNGQLAARGSNGWDGWLVTTNR